MISAFNTLTLVDEAQAGNVITRGEEALKGCWTKLALVQRTDTASDSRAQAFMSLQPNLFSALFELESFYNQICKIERELISKKATINSDIFSKEIQKIDHYKRLVDNVIDIGKSLGDAFAWIFYQLPGNRQFLRKHYEHEFIPRLPTRDGGTGEVEFIRNFQMYGHYFALAHSTTTFLRSGDVSLIDPSNMLAAAIGELKTQRVSPTEISVVIVIPRGQHLPPEMLPKLSTKPEPVKNPQTKPLDSKFLNRLKRQITFIENVFHESPSVKGRQLQAEIACSKLEELYSKSTPQTWGQIKAGRGLMLIGIKPEGSGLFSPYSGTPQNMSEDYKRNLNSASNAAIEIVDKKLPDNAVIIGWMPFSPNERYQLALKMRPLFWWPLTENVRKALTFKEMVVMTLYNPAFLLDSLRKCGLHAKFSKERGFEISKKSGGGELIFRGMDYLYKIIQAHLVGEDHVVELVRQAIEAIEERAIKRTSLVNLDFDFTFQ